MKAIGTIMMLAVFALVVACSTASTEPTLKGWQGPAPVEHTWLIPID
jgi:hypothetical protein